MSTENLEQSPDKPGEDLEESPNQTGEDKEQERLEEDPEENHEENLDEDLEKESEEERRKLAEENFPFQEDDLGWEDSLSQPPSNEKKREESPEVTEMYEKADQLYEAKKKAIRRTELEKLRDWSVNIAAENTRISGTENAGGCQVNLAEILSPPRNHDIGLEFCGPIMEEW